MAESLNVTTPYAGMAWGSWVGVVTLELGGAYNVPSAVPEALWQSWATELLNIPELVELGVSSPDAFGTDWRAWAASFILALS